MSRWLTGMESWYGGTRQAAHVSSFACAEINNVNVPFLAIHSSRAACRHSLRQASQSCAANWQGSQTVGRENCTLVSGHAQQNFGLGFFSGGGSFGMTGMSSFPPIVWHLKCGRFHLKTARRKEKDTSAPLFSAIEQCRACHSIYHDIQGSAQGAIDSGLLRDVAEWL